MRVCAGSPPEEVDMQEYVVKLWSHTRVPHYEEGRLRERTGGAASQNPGKFPEQHITTKSSLASYICAGSKGDTGEETSLLHLRVCKHTVTGWLRSQFSPPVRVLGIELWLVSALPCLPLVLPS